MLRQPACAGSVWTALKKKGIKNAHTYRGVAKMDFFILMILLALGFYIIVWILGKMPQPIQEAVKDALRFLFKGN